MGNSSSKQQNGKSACAPWAIDVTHNDGTGQKMPTKNPKNKPRHGRDKKKKQKQSISIGIVSHPYQQENPGQYQDEESSSSSSDDVGSYGGENDVLEDFDNSFLEPRGLFKDSSTNPRTQQKHSHNRRSKNLVDDSRLSTESLTYSESSASAAITNASLSMASKSLSAHSFGICADRVSNIGIGPVQDPTAGPTIAKMEDIKGKKKKGSLFRGMKSRKRIEKEHVPYEKTLSFLMDETYGKSPAEKEARPHHTRLQDQISVQGDGPDASSMGFRDGAVPRPILQNCQLTHHRDSSIFSDGKLPTIADVSYQSSAVNYESDNREDEHNNEKERNEMKSLNILSDLAEHDYEEGKGVGTPREKISEWRTCQDSEGNGDKYSRLNDYNNDNASMVSREYTVTTVEADDLAYPYSATKNIQGLTNIMEERETINLMLDKQHASYVEGEEPLKDIGMPTTNLGNLFANVNLTLNDTLTSKYQSLHHDNEDEGSDKSSVHGDQLYQAAVSQGEALNHTKSVELRAAAKFKVGQNTNTSDEERSLDDDKCEDEFSQFVIDRTIAPQDSTQNLDGSDVEDCGNTKEPSIALNDTCVDEFDDSLLKDNSDDVNDVLSDSSLEDSRMDDSLFQNNAEEVHEVLSDSSVDESRSDKYLDKIEGVVDADLSSMDETNEELIDHVDNTFNRTDMAIHENLLDRTDMAIILKDFDSDIDGLHTLEEKSESKNLEKISASSKCNDESSSLSTTSIEINEKKPEMKHSPFPNVELTNAPLTSELTNLLPQISRDETEDELLLPTIELKEALCANKNTTNFGETLHYEEKNCRSERESVGALKMLGTKTISVSQNCPSRGVEIGTMIKLVRMTPKEVQLDRTTSITESVVLKNKDRKPAFSVEVEKNSAFLFDGERTVRNPNNVSKVDNQRLSLLNYEHSGRYSSSLSFPIVDIAEDDSLETIQKKLLKLKMENHERNASRHRSSIIVTRSQGELTINGGWPKRALKNSDDDVCREVSNEEESLSKPNPSSSEPPEENVREKEEKSAPGLNKLKRNRLGEHLSSDHGNTCDNPVEQAHSDLVSKASSNYDDISITDLQMKYTAITPMKTKSPHIRFKKALRMFDIYHDKKDLTVTCTVEPRKTPPRKNASSTKEDFVFSKVTSINGRLRKNSQRSLKKKRRLTSGNETIAPRKPILVNPLFRKPNKADSNNSEPFDDTSFENPKYSSILDIVEDSITESTHGGRLKHNEEIDDFQSNDLDDKSGPHDIAGETDISISSSASMNSSLSIDEIAALMKADSTDSPNNPLQSPVRKLNGLRSAMKKARDDRNENNRVSWFAGVSTQNDDESPLRNLENSLAHSPKIGGFDSMSSHKEPSRKTDFVTACSTDGKSKIYVESDTHVAHSPVGEIAGSPQIQDSIILRSPLSSTSLNNDPDTSNKENEVCSMHDSVSSFSPLTAFRDNAAVIPTKRIGPISASELNLSPGPGRRTSSQNRKWTTNVPTKKSWRDLKMEHDSRKKKKPGSKRKTTGKKDRTNGLKKTSLFL